MNPYPTYPYGGYQPGPFYPQPAPDLMQRQQPVSPQISGVNPMQSSGNGMIWVRTKEEADAFMVAAGSAVALWDANNPVIYLRQADPTGKPSTIVYDLVERTNEPKESPAPQPQVDLTPYMTREELKGMLDKLTSEIDNLWERMESVQTNLIKRPTKASKPKEDTDNA